ncbi:MAG: hypothetical protein O3B90_12415 [Actinomycetota bacterium]|nr:hypothetical protein [Actinomycetota bacterium]
MGAKRGPKSMSEDHKAAMERGRAEGRVVREYLEALRSTKPKRGRKRTPDSITKRLGQIETEFSNASAIDELKLVQERRDLNNELESMGTSVDLSSLEQEFLRVASAYGERKGISYGSWREVGVSAATLKNAGIGRGG